MRTNLLFLFLLFSASSAMAQLNPAKWVFSAEKVNDTEYNLILTASLDPGWFIYSQYLASDDGPIRTSLSFGESKAFELLGKAEEKGDKKEGYDDIFMMDVIKFSGTTQFVQRIKTLENIETISGAVEFMCCDKNRCIPPQEIEFNIDLPK